MRMPLAVGRSRPHVQHPHGARQALPVLRPRITRPGRRHDRHHRAANLPLPALSVELAPSPHNRASHVSAGRRHRGLSNGLGRRVLDPLDLAELIPSPAYWNYAWDSNPPTYYSSPSSSGWPLKSSMEAEAVAAAVYPSASISQSTISARGTIARPPASILDDRPKWGGPLVRGRRPRRPTSCLISPHRNPDRKEGDAVCLKS
jgi:hypothetical protein